MRRTAGRGRSGMCAAVAGPAGSAGGRKSPRTAGGRFVPIGSERSQLGSHAALRPDHADSAGPGARRGHLVRRGGRSAS